MSDEFAINSLAQKSSCVYARGANYDSLLNKFNAFSSKFKIRDECNLSIEEKRASKEIGSSLEAALTIHLSKKKQELIKDINLAELCITSSAKIKDSLSEKILVETAKAEGIKCPVCWKISLKPCSRNNCGLNVKKN